MAQLDRLDGDIDTLMTRIAHVRTWTTSRTARIGSTVRPNAGPRRARSRPPVRRTARPHHQRFVDRRSAFLVRQLAVRQNFLASVDKSGEVRVEGAYVGRLDGFRFVPDAAEGDAYAP